MTLKFAITVGFRLITFKYYFVPLFISKLKHKGTVFPPPFKAHFKIYPSLNEPIAQNPFDVPLRTSHFANPTQSLPKKDKPTVNNSSAPSSSKTPNESSKRLIDLSLSLLLVPEIYAGARSHMINWPPAHDPRARGQDGPSLSRPDGASDWTLSPRNRSRLTPRTVIPPPLLHTLRESCRPEFLVLLAAMMDRPGRV